MALFEQTQAALEGIDANRQHIFGLHGGDHLVAGGVGKFVYDEPFDPARHDPHDINPFSIMEERGGLPQVSVNVPDRPLYIGIVTHHRSLGKSDFSEMNNARQTFASKLGIAIRDALPGMTDYSKHFAIGRTAEGVLDPYVEVIETDGNPIVEANTIAEICQAGLTFVISDYLALPLERHKLPATIAIKANHAFDLELPAGAGPLPTNLKGGEVNTNNRKELNRVNSSQLEQHRITIGRLEAAGIKVAKVLFHWGKFPEKGFDEVGADQSIAAAVNNLQA
ncbi:MAG TPA: hypothetical protein VLF79_02795 [Candidatus Saccharimonadales bacterium]|nr:hypothetical protein [Candidatus Saccharimonadales bacterium]